MAVARWGWGEEGDRGQIPQSLLEFIKLGATGSLRGGHCQGPNDIWERSLWLLFWRMDGRGARAKARALVIVITIPSLPTSQGHCKVPMRFMLTPRKAQRHGRRHVSSHVLKPLLQVGACRVWHHLFGTVSLYGFQGNRVGWQVLPCLSYAAVQAQMNSHT